MDLKVINLQRMQFWAKYLGYPLSKNLQGKTLYAMVECENRGSDFLVYLREVHMYI